MRRKGLLGVVLGVVFVAGAAGTAGALKHTVCVETSESPGDPFCWEFDDGTGNPIPTGGGNGGNGNGQGGGGGGDGGNKCDAECKKKRCEDTAIEKAAACSLAVDFMFDWCVDEWGMSQAISSCTTAVGSSYMAFGFNGQPRTQIREHSHTCVYLPGIPPAIPSQYVCQENQSLFDLPAYDDPWLRQETWPSTLGDGKHNSAWSWGYCDHGSYVTGGCLMEFYQGIPNCGGGFRNLSPTKAAAITPIWLPTSSRTP